VGCGLAGRRPAITLRRVSSSVFRFRHRVTYAECTVGNHVYYARYLDILEAARGEFFRHLGQPFTGWQEAGVIFPVVEAQLRYKRAARYDDVLTVELAVAEPGRARLTFLCRMLDEAGHLLVESTTVHACTGLDEKPQRLPDTLRAALLPFVAAPV
jgi:acyl-CoA thioester hydrolase